MSAQGRADNGSVLHLNVNVISLDLGDDVAERERNGLEVKLPFVVQM